MLVVRRRVSALLDSLAGRRLVVVLGDAASGKSVAVTHWLADRDEAHAVVTPAEGHDNPRDLFAAVVAATATLRPGLLARLGPELDARQAGTDDDADLPGVLAGALAAAWADLGTTPFTLVVDDLDTVRDPSGQAFVADLVRLHPRTVRTLLLARSAPPFAVRRLAAAGEYGELAPRALRFDAAETAALFAASGVPLDSEQAAGITDACGGWAGGLRLAVEAALTDGPGAITGLTDRLGSSAAPDYLADVALRDLDEASRGTVRALAVLGRVERAVTSRSPASATRLDALADRGLLVVADGDGWSLTALARYAVDRVMPPEPDAVAEVLAECVAMALDAGCPEPALRWAARHGSPELVRHTLARTGAGLLDSGSDVLTDAADRLPVPVGDPELDSVLASYFALRGDMARAQAHLPGDRATVHPPRLGWRLASALWMHGDAAGALQAVAVTTPAQPGTADAAQLATMRATLAWGRGDGGAARAAADEALAEARTSGDHAALGAAWVAQALVTASEGDLVRNARCYSTALTHAITGRDVLTQLRIRCNVGSHLTETGRHREALVELDEALRLGEATGQRTRTALARLNQGQARLGLGLLDEALLDADAALTLWTDLDSPMAAYAQQLRGEILARRGDRTRAASAFRAAVAAARQQQDAQTLAPATAWLARCLVVDDPDRAAELAAQAVAEPAALGTLPAVLARGWIALHRGDHDTARSDAADARAQAGQRDDPAALAQALVLDLLATPSAGANDGRLSEARVLVEEIGDAVAQAELDVVEARLRGERRAAAAARTRLRALGVRDSAAFVAGPLAVLHERDRSAIRIRTLGGFAVELGDEVVAASAWQSRKARDLVKILTARAGKPVPRDTLAQLLWPEAADSSGNKLSVALSTARAVFDPAKAHPADHVIVADRDAVRLNTRTVAVDVEDYLALSDDALDAPVSSAVPLLEAAVAAYAGDFCEEDPYEAWAGQTRDELRARHQQVLNALADLLLRAGRHDEVVPRLLSLLAMDGYDERTHLRLVGALVKAGRHGEARRAYRTYLDRMAELDIEPAAFPQPAAPTR